MKHLSLFITGFLSLSGTAQSVKKAQQLEQGDRDFFQSFITEETELSMPTSPVVKKFSGNIYADQFWSDSVYHDYLNAFWTGYNMQSYNYATTCLDNFNLFMDVFHTWKLAAVRKKKFTELWDLFFITAGTTLNESWYNCYLYYDDIKMSYSTKWENFADFGDIYLSFIFNMLQNSLNIKSQTENMIIAYELHNTVTFTQALGSVLRSILDFDSYTALSSSLTADENKTPTKEEFLGISKAYKTNVPTKQERLAVTEAQLATHQKHLDEMAMEERMAAAKAEKEGKKGMVQLLHKAHVNKSRKHDPVVGLQPGFEWQTSDYIQAPLAFIIGSLHALPDESSGPDCSSNATSLRRYILEGFDQSALGSPKEAALSYYTGGAYLDNVGVDCQVAIVSTLSVSYWSELFSTWYISIPTNLAYNAGYMWVDVVNYVYFTQETVPENDWAFFVSYLLGDFSIRLFYHDNTPQQIDL